MVTTDNSAKIRAPPGVRPDYRQALKDKEADSATLRRQ
jgi:hypothetical protein